MIEEGRPYPGALEEAQALGYAEADPTGDVEGDDAVNKLVIIANAVLGRPTRLDEIEVVGIRRVTEAELGDARAGDEVVQLYIHDPVASISQPVRRLRSRRRRQRHPAHAHARRSVGPASSRSERRDTGAASPDRPLDANRRRASPLPRRLQRNRRQARLPRADPIPIFSFGRPS